MHLPQTRDIPELCGKIAAFFDLLFVEPNVLTTWRDAHQTKSQAVGAIFLNQLERIRRVAQRLRHLSPELVTNQAREINMTKRNIVFIAVGFARLELKPRDNHARHPEENDVRRGDEHAGWIKFPARLFIHRLISP